MARNRAQAITAALTIQRVGTRLEAVNRDADAELLPGESRLAAALLRRIAARHGLPDTADERAVIQLLQIDDRRR